MSKTDLSVDQYTKLKNELTQLILKKQDIDAQLLALEESIYDKENDYFNDSVYGNIVKGFDNFAKLSAGGSNKRKMTYTDDDHIFSLSSATFVKTLMKTQGMTSGQPDLDDYEDSVDPGNGSNPSKESGAGTPGRKRKPN